MFTQQIKHNFIILLLFWFKLFLSFVFIVGHRSLLISWFVVLLFRITHIKYLDKNRHKATFSLTSSASFSKITFWADTNIWPNAKCPILYLYCLNVSLCGFRMRLLGFFNIPPWSEWEKAWEAVSVELPNADLWLHGTVPGSLKRKCHTDEACTSFRGR